MLINLSDVLSDQHKTVEETVPLTMGEIRMKFGKYPIVESEPVHVRVEHVRGKEMLIYADTRLVTVIPCDRCLEEVEVPFDLSIVQKLVAPDRADRDALEEQEAFMEGYSLNIDSLIDNEITTSWPMKVLCRPDCKGLCPVCGKDLNTGACGCDTFVPDPRMAAIMDVFNANKEV